MSLEEIAKKHDYNLNISRYISTAEAEKEIVLEDVNAELERLEKDIVKATELHNTFLDELKLLRLYIGKSDK